MGDWLGTDEAATQLRQYRSFGKARMFARNLALKSGSEWYKYAKSGKKPADIPTCPNRTYAEAGWAGMGDWLGSGRRRGTGWRPFKQARTFAQNLSLKSVYQWYDYCQSGRKPADIPNSPDYVYAKAGWAGYGDWLGTGTVASFLRQHRPFKKARAFARGLGLKSGAEWSDYAKSGKKPDDIPANPSRTYAEAGWAGIGDWLGTGRVSNRRRKFRSFLMARAFVRRLGMNSFEEWCDYCKSAKKPDDIPSNPNRTYADAGWAGWGDWLRTASVVRRSTSIQPADQVDAQGVAY
jgi:hypothetical protein